MKLPLPNFLRIRAIYIIIISFLSLAWSHENLQCKDIVSKSSVLLLKNYLLCDYDTTIRPSLNNKNTTQVQFLIIPKFIEFDDLTSTFNVHAWTLLAWTDVHLKWDPAKFNKTRNVHINTDEVWTPDISVHNSGDLSKEQNKIPFTQCELRYNGKIYCITSMTYTVHCGADYTMWPYDTQNCSIQLASWSHSGMEVTFKLAFQEMILEDYKPNWQWELLSSGINIHMEKYKFKHQESSPMITVHFLFQRQASSIHYIYITPIFVLIILTLTTLWLDARSPERTTVACVNFFCHLLAIMNFHWNIPYNGSIAPNLLIFYESSFTLAATSLMLSVILREVNEFDYSPPTFFVTTTVSILRSHIGQVLLLNIMDPRISASFDVNADDNVDIMKSSKKQHIWKYIVILIEWICFIVIAFTYIILLCLYMPKMAF